MFDIRRHIEICHLVTFVCFDLVVFGHLLQQNQPTHTHTHACNRSHTYTETSNTVYTQRSTCYTRLSPTLSCPLSLRSLSIVLLVAFVVVVTCVCICVCTTGIVGSMTIINHLIGSINDVIAMRVRIIFTFRLTFTAKFAYRFSPSPTFYRFSADGAPNCDRNILLRN